MRASEILEYDFVSEYLRHVKPEKKEKFITIKPETEYLKPANEVSVNIWISADMATYKDHFVEFLTSLNQTAKALGFKIK